MDPITTTNEEFLNREEILRKAMSVINVKPPNYEATTTLHKCICGKQKGETNHWLTGFVDEFGIHISAFYPGNDARVFHLCSEGCLNRAMAKWYERVRQIG